MRPSTKLALFADALILGGVALAALASAWWLLLSALGFALLLLAAALGGDA